MSKELLFNVTASDCRWDYFRGSGAGGQKRNKTSSAVRCTHEASGATGQSQDERSQIHNKRLAFKRMAGSKEFRAWIRLEAARLTGLEDQVRAYVDREINSDRIQVEVKANGKWVKEGI